MSETTTEAPRPRGRPRNNPIPFQDINVPENENGIPVLNIEEQTPPEVLEAAFAPPPTVVGASDPPVFIVSSDPRQQALSQSMARPVIWASIGAKINTGNYENQSVDIGVSGIPVGASDEFIDEQIQKANITLQKVVYGLAAEMGRIMREDYGR